jgi:predicted negative regulator of RcsB-dependent stress response
MAYDLEEQEQIAAIRSWWQQYGKLVITVASAIVIAIASFQGWRYYQHRQTVEAVTLYEQMRQADRAGDAKKVRAIAGEIIDRYRRTPYAAMAALAAAKAAFDGGDLAAARSHLQWVIDRAEQEELRDLARLRLAGVLVDEKNHAEALRLLEVKHGDAFSGLYADLRGDILVAQGKAAEARSAYQLAFEKSDPQSPYRAMIQAKLDALGEVK